MRLGSQVTVISTSDMIKLQSDKIKDSNQIPLWGFCVWCSKSRIMLCLSQGWSDVSL